MNVKGRYGACVGAMDIKSPKRSLARGGLGSLTAALLNGCFQGRSKLSFGIMPQGTSIRALCQGRAGLKINPLGFGALPLFVRVR